MGVAHVASMKLLRKSKRIMGQTIVDTSPSPDGRGAGTAGRRPTSWRGWGTYEPVCGAMSPGACHRTYRVGR